MLFMISIINNSPNVDMQQYLNAKRRICSHNIIFAQNLHCERLKTDMISSISLRNSFSIKIVADLLLGFILTIRLKLKSVRLILFDSAHISNIPVAIFAKILRIKLVFTLHDWVPHDGRMKKATQIYNYVITKFLADHLICFSKIQSNLPHSVLTLSGYQSNFDDSKISNDTFIFFGRMEPYKGIENLIPIAKRLNDLMPSAKIQIYGAGYDPALIDLVKLNNVEVYNNFISEENLNNSLKSAIAVLVPYNSATQSGVVVKSFSQGVPVVAFNVGAMSSYIQDGYDGYIVKHKDINTFCDRMVEASNNRILLNKNIRDSFESKYGISSLVKQYEQLLKDL